MLIPFSTFYRFRKLIRGIFILLWICAFTATHIPGKDMPDLHTSDTILHLVGFTGLAAWFVLAAATFIRRLTVRAPLTVVVMLSYAAIDELTQPYFGRSCELHDWINDAIGTGIAIIIVESLLRLLVKKP